VKGIKKWWWAIRSFYIQERVEGNSRFRAGLGVAMALSLYRLIVQVEEEVRKDKRRLGI